MEKEYKLQELIDIVDNFEKGKITLEKLNNFADALTVRSYLPIMEKTTLITDVAFQHIYSYIDSVEFQVAELYRYLFFYVLLGSYALIDCSDIKLITYENYDKLYPIFTPAILKYCEEDYKYFKNMLNDTLNLYNNNKIAEVVENVDAEALKTATEENRKLIASLSENKELIGEINNIAVLNNPTIADLVGKNKVNK